MVERRDQVRTTFLSLARFIVSILVIRCVSMKGPFFVLLAMIPQLLSSRFLLASPIHDEAVSTLVVARLVSASRLAPRRYRMPSARGLAFTTAMWVIDRIHRHPAVHRTTSHPAFASRLADGNVFMVGVAHLTDRGHAIDEHPTCFARRQLQQSVVAFLRNQLRRASSGAHHLRALTGLQLHVVDGGTGRNIAKWKRIAHQDVGLRTADDLLPYLQSNRLQDVALLSIGVGE